MEVCHSRVLSHDCKIGRQIVPYMHVIRNSSPIQSIPTYILHIALITLVSLISRLSVTLCFYLFLRLRSYNVMPPYSISVFSGSVALQIPFFPKECQRPN